MRGTAMHAPIMIDTGRGEPFGLAGSSSFPTLGKDVRPLFDALEGLGWRISRLDQIPSRFRQKYFFRENFSKRGFDRFEVLVRLTNKHPVLNALTADPRDVLLPGGTQEMWVSLAAIHDLPADPNYSRIELVAAAATAPATTASAPEQVRMLTKLDNRCVVSSTRKSRYLRWLDEEFKRAQIDFQSGSQDGSGWPKGRCSESARPFPHIFVRQATFAVGGAALARATGSKWPLVIGLGIAAFDHFGNYLWSR